MRRRVGTWVNSWLPRGLSWLQDGVLGLTRKQRTSAWRLVETGALPKQAPFSIVSCQDRLGAHQGCRRKAAAGAHAHPTTFARYSSRFCRWQRATGLTALLPLHTIHIVVESQVFHLLTEANFQLVNGCRGPGVMATIHTDGKRAISTAMRPAGWLLVACSNQCHQKQCLHNACAWLQHE